MLPPVEYESIRRYLSEDGTNTDEEERIDSSIDIFKIVMQRERISLRYKHTRINTLNLGISIQPAYPSTAANLELESETLHEDVQKKLLTKLTALAEEASKKGEKGECHVKELIQFTERYLSSTAFISCYEEMKQIHSLIDKDNIKLNKKRATVKVKLSCDAYILDVLIRVPKHYPDQIVDVDVLTPNPPKSPPSSSSSSASTPSASIPAKRTPSKRDTKQKSKVKTGSSSNFNENNKYNINSDRNSIRDHHNITMMDDKASVIDSGNQTTGHMNMYKKMKGSTNYPPYIIESFRRQITRTLGRLEKGHSVQAALMSMMDVHNRNKGLETEKEGLMQELQRQRNQLQSKDLTSLKQDLAFMHKSRDLLKVRKEDKGMRRQLVRLNKKEQAKHDSLDEKEREAALKEEKRVMEKLGLQVHDQTPATPSLWAMVSFIHQLAHTPQTECQVCQKQALPANHLKLSKLKFGDKKFPVRVHCGEWFHFKCLEQFITNPPFGIACGVCQLRVTHPYWPSDIQVLEKRWSNERAKQRELGEVFDFMGFDDDDDYVGDGDGKERSSFGGVTAIDGGKKKIKLKGKKKRKKRK